MDAQDCVPLVKVFRGETVESIHFGAFLVMDAAGKVLAAAGNQWLLTFPRSSIKPFQALPFVEQGGLRTFGFSSQELAIMCASHSGTDLHKSVLMKMQAKINVGEKDLSCGVHWPGDRATREAMQAAGENPTPNRHNCSGKHTGMLAHARLRDLPIEDYLNPDHPVQVTIRETLADMVSKSPDEMPLGIDGCSAPVYAIPMKNMAQAVAHLADPVGLTPERAAACREITTAMISHPDMVAGPGKFDTDLMKAAHGKVFSKGGAEGYQIMGVMPGVLTGHSPGLGIAIKISDGDRNGRARTLVALKILEALGVLDKSELAALDAYGQVPVRNWRKLIVGEICPAFTIEFEMKAH